MATSGLHYFRQESPQSVNYYGYIPTFLEHQIIKKPSDWTFSRNLPTDDTVIKEFSTSTPPVDHSLSTSTPAVPIGSREGSRLSENNINSLTRVPEKPKTSGEKQGDTTPEGVLQSQKLKKNDSTVQELFVEMRTYLGFPEKVSKDPIPTYGKEGVAIKRMITRGFTKEEILKCWKTKVDFSKEFVSMTWVNQDIGKNGNGHRPPKQENPENQRLVDEINQHLEIK